MSVDIVQTYRRIIRAARDGKGVRLSPAECFQMANIDQAIQQAVDSADEHENENPEREIE